MLVRSTPLHCYWLSGRDHGRIRSPARLVRARLIIVQLVIARYLSELEWDTGWLNRQVGFRLQWAPYRSEEGR
jgi:hypothetical protein